MLMQKLMRIFLSGISLILLSAAAQLAKSPEALGQDSSHEAMLLYQKGDFAGAADIYLQLITRQPHHASLYHNLGSALYRNGETGAAVAAYMRALQLRPRDPDFKFNLAFLLSKNADKLEARLPSQGWNPLVLAQHFSTRELLFLSALSCLLVSGIGVFLLWRRESKRLLLSLTLPLGILSLYLGLNLFARVRAPANWGAVQVKELAAYSSPTGKNAVQIFRLHEGAPFAVLETAGDWIKIGLSDQKTGWVPKSQVVVFGPTLHIYQRAKAQPEPNAKAALP